jgi:LuxR family maltose regulon positive regulatory protein
LTVLLNEIAAIPANIILVLDDYHVIEDKTVGNILTFLLEHLPPQMHLVITTREDPNLPLARLRARNQLTELRATDLRFTDSEAAEFLNQVMGLSLSAEDIAVLEARTEGWISAFAEYPCRGITTLALLSNLFGHHHFVLDYLIESFGTAARKRSSFFAAYLHLDRMCGPFVMRFSLILCIRAGN